MTQSISPQEVLAAVQIGAPPVIGYDDVTQKAFSRGWNQALNRVYSELRLAHRLAGNVDPVRFDVNSSAGEIDLAVPFADMRESLKATLPEGYVGMYHEFPGGVRILYWPHEGAAFVNWIGNPVADSHYLDRMGSAQEAFEESARRATRSLRLIEQRLESLLDQPPMLVDAAWIAAQEDRVLLHTIPAGSVDREHAAVAIAEIGMRNPEYAEALVAISMDLVTEIAEAWNENLRRSAEKENRKAEQMHRAPHELTLREFAQAVEVRPLGPTGGIWPARPCESHKWHVRMGEWHASVDADSPDEAVQITHEASIRNALATRDPVYPGGTGNNATSAMHRLERMPPSAVLSDYPHLGAEFPRQIRSGFQAQEQPAQIVGGPSM